MNDDLRRIKKPTVTAKSFHAPWVESTVPLDVDDLGEKPPGRVCPLPTRSPSGRSQSAKPE